MPLLARGAPAYVTGTERSAAPSSNLSSALLFGPSAPAPAPVQTTSFSPPPAYTSIYPPSPPSSPPESSSLSHHFAPKSLLLPACASIDDAVTSNSVLTSVFPATSPIHALPSTNVDLGDLVPEWKGAVVEHKAMGTRTLFVAGGSCEDVNLRESICGVLEKAEEELGCTGVVMCLEKDTPDLGNLLHSLMYVGGTITTGPFAPVPAYILVGLDL